MKDYLRPVFLKFHVQAVHIAYIPDDDTEEVPGVFFPQLPVEIKESVFTAIIKYEMSWVMFEYLAAKLRTYGPCRPCDQDPFTAYKVPDVFGIYLYRLSEQEVFNRNIPDLVEQDLAFDNIPEAWKGLEDHFIFFALTHDLLDLKRFCRGDGNNNLFGTIVIDKRVQVLPGTEDR